MLFRTILAPFKNSIKIRLEFIIVSFRAIIFSCGWNINSMALLGL